MHLYLVRHGQAQSRHDDPQRGLTDAGTREVRRMADHLAERAIVVDRIWHSDKARAAQTAALIAERLNPPDGCVERDGLKPNDSVTPIAESLEAFEGSLMIVGHLPFVDDLAERLLGSHPTGRLTPCAGVMCLRRGEHGAWSGLWMTRPAEV